MAKITAIDGTGHDKPAPRPQRGMTQAVFDCIEACGGANFKQIQKYLPAAIEKSSQIITKKRLEKVLYYTVYQGYLVHDTTGITNKGYWKIAPLSYYNTRRQIIADLKKHAKPRSIKLHTSLQPRPLWHWHLIVSLVAISFLLGLTLGMYIR